VLSRNADNARKILGEAPEIVEGDITARESIIEALSGVSAVILSVSAFAPKLIRKFRQAEAQRWSNGLLANKEVD